MLRHTNIAIAVIVAAAASASTLRAQACGAATDTATVILQVQMRHLAASTKPEDGWTRSAYKIPHGVDSTTIVAVTQNATCTKALAAFNATLPNVSPLPTKIYLVKVGAVYVAMHPLSGEHYWPYAVLDSKFKVLSTFAQ